MNRYTRRTAAALAAALTIFAACLAGIAALGV